MPVRSYAAEAPREAGWSCIAGGVEVDVLASDSHPFVTFEIDGPTEIVIHPPTSVDSAKITPVRHGIEASVVEGAIRFIVPGPIHLVIEIPGYRSLYVWANKPEVDPPERGEPGVTFFEAGVIHEIGLLRLQANETVYLEGGAIVRGVLRATEAHHLRICGPGILDGESIYPTEGRRLIVIEGSRDVRVEDIIMIRPKLWMLTIGACEDVVVRGIKQIGTVSSSDGIDVVGSKRVQIRDCFLRNGDDCVAVKALDLRGEPGILLDHSENVEDLEVSGCILQSYIGGNALEIGFELRCDHVRNIRFSDCDVLAVHQYGSAFSIHNSDRAMVENVTFENIRVEHHYDKLIDLRIVTSRWGRDPERGHIRNVSFVDIDVTELIYNDGYTCSLIGGYDEAHRIEGVHFKNVRLGGRPVRNADDVWLYSKHTSDVTFE